MTRDDISGLAKRRSCPRCDLDKTIGHALCRSCRSKLPPHMRLALERIPAKEPFDVSRAMKAAANYFNVHFQSIRKFGGGKKH